MRFISAAAEKTPIIRRLVERVYFGDGGDIDFLIRELRTPELLVELVRRYPGL